MAPTDTEVVHYQSELCQANCSLSYQEATALSGCVSQPPSPTID